MMDEWIDVQDMEGLRMNRREKVVAVLAPIVNKTTDLDFREQDNKSWF